MRARSFLQGSYGSVVMALTIFSTVFSGFILVAVPFEMYILGLGLLSSFDG